MHSPFLSRNAWSAVLSEAGLSSQIAFPSQNRSGSDYALLICQKPLLERSRDENFDGVFWFQNSDGKAELQSFEDWLSAARSAQGELEKLDASLERSSARFCCIVSLDPKTAKSRRSRVESLVAEEFIAARAAMGPVQWIRLVWDALLDHPQSVRDSEAVLKISIGSGAANSYVALTRGSLPEAIPEVKVRGSERVVTRLNARPQLRTPFLAPSSQKEQGVARIWEEILGIQGVGADDNFFELGGESLLATQLTTRIREQYGVQLPLKELFLEPTIAGLCKMLEQHAVEGDGRRDEIVASPRQVRRVKRSSDGLVTVER